ncbi:MAG TPA: SCO family protein [Bryobacteraceae bacterium]|jgi:protein SCO1/2|nr:SCO family protein [Bryobacteraceae bacterium]
MKWVVAALLAVLAGCHTGPPPLDDYGIVPEFQLTDQHSNPFDSRSLDGRVWVADFIYTTCGSICPRMTSQMHQIQSALQRTPHVRLISFTVDPKRDTPAVLAEYAKVHHASDIWYFLTGPQPVLQHLDRDVFKLGNVDGSLMHSNRFVLVDSKAHIRGYYDTSEESSIPQLVRDVHVLLRERAG